MFKINLIHNFLRVLVLSNRLIHEIDYSILNKQKKCSYYITEGYNRSNYLHKQA